MESHGGMIWTGRTEELREKHNLLLVLYGCETRCLILTEQHTLRVFENSVLGRIFGPKRDEVQKKVGRLRVYIYIYIYMPIWYLSDYGLDDRANGVRFPAGAKDFSSSLCVQTSSGAHPASCTMGTGGPFPGSKSAAGA
jgi:hypothetical protein